MKENLVKIIHCEKCENEFARIIEISDKKELVVNEPEMKLMCLSNNPKKYVAVCPKCQYQTAVDIQLLRGF